ncbi:MAG TPA: hypothetical protein VH116_00435, partial [Gemmatimonadales bacterium]|nr:hypothetical protein [Gemmatimonadales bacterium]
SAADQERRMSRAWMPEEPADELENLFVAEREAWRGELHPAEESWRGAEHLADWPESAAGPEYWMYKRAADEG